MGRRHEARECALQCLYQWEICAPDDVDLMLARFWAARGGAAGEDVREFAESLVRGAIVRAAEIDSLIAEQADNWRLDRMSTVDRNILRLGVSELLADDPPPAAVVIDEAIELAKRFSGEGAGQFVNGILDGIRRRLSGTGDGAESPDPGGSGGDADSRKAMG